MTLFRLRTILVLYALAMANLSAQETDSQDTMKALEATKESIIDEEKDALKLEVKKINRQLDNDEITLIKAEELKKAAAEKHALNIENRLAIVENKIALLKRNGDTTGDQEIDKLEIIFLSKGKLLDVDYHPKKIKYDRRTTSHLVFAFGLNNVITEGESLNDTDFKVGGSRFAEFGWAWKTRVFDNSNWLRIKYGFSFMLDGLKPTDNRYYVVNGDQTNLETYPVGLRKSKFRQDKLVFPIHFEFGPSRKIERKNYYRYTTNNKLKIGIGGYGGFLLSSRQKLKYKENGQDVKLKLKGSYNANNFIYGVSGYIGWRWAAAYVKYDLNTIFKNNPVEQRNISLGLRFDLN